jgi:hypothetical protein
MLQLDQTQTAANGIRLVIRISCPYRRLVCADSHLTGAIGRYLQLRIGQVRHSSSRLLLPEI